MALVIREEEQVVISVIQPITEMTTQTGSEMNSNILCYVFMLGTYKYCCLGAHTDDHVTNKRTAKQIVQKICFGRLPMTASLRIMDRGCD